MSENNHKKKFEDLAKTRTVLKEKLKNIKLNQIGRVNLLEDTFQPITKPLKKIIGKLEDKIKDMYIDSTFDDDDDNDDVKGDNVIIGKLEDKYKNIDSTIDDNDDYYYVNCDSDDFQYKNISIDNNDDEQNYDNNRPVSSTCIKVLNRKESLKLTKTYIHT